VTADTFQVQLDAQKERIQKIENTLDRTQPAVIATEVRQLRADFKDLSDKVTANTRAQWALAAAILVGALSVAVTASQVAGGG
jgi:hypothetical protein